MPTSGGSVEIPPVRMSVFDPEKGEYVSLATAAIPLEVEATAMDEALARGGDPTLAKERVRLRDRDIRYVKPAPSRLRREGDGRPWSDPMLLAAHVVPALAFATSAVVRRHRDRLRKDARYARRRRAARAAGKQLDAARGALGGKDLEPVFAHASAALRGYVADRLHLAAANLEEADVRRGLAENGLAEPDVQELFDLLSSCDGARFSPLGSDPSAAAQLVERARAWIHAAERR